MINSKTGLRELAYVVAIDNIEPIVGSDNCECAVVNGWRVMVRKNTFEPGDKAVYFEIDSKLPEEDGFAFLAAKHYKVKTQKYTFGGKNPGFYSQGLLMSFDDFGWDNNTHEVGDFLTELLGVTYAEAEDSKRKGGKTVDKYQKMLNRNPHLAKNNFVRWCWKYTVPKKILYRIFALKYGEGRKFPAWVKITDEERVQNLGPALEDYSQMKWIVTEKIDGSSSTYTMIRDGRKFDYYVCSRRVVMNGKDSENKGYYAETAGNIYMEMNNKYDMENVCREILEQNNDLKYVTIQGEVYGDKVQKRNYNLTGRDLAVFNVIYGYKDGTEVRLNPFEGCAIMEYYCVPFVPIVDIFDNNLPSSVDKILEYASGKSEIDGGMREGIVLRTYDGVYSFKAVDNEFLMRYHG